MHAKEMQKHESFFSRRANWTKPNAAPKMMESTEIKALLGTEKAA